MRTVARPLDRVVTVGNRNVQRPMDLRGEEYAEALSGPVTTRMMTPEERERYGDPVPVRDILRRYVAREPIPDIARATGQSEAIVRRAIATARQRGDIAREDGRWRLVRGNDQDPAPKPDAAEQALGLVVAGHTQFQAAEATGLTEAQVVGALERAVTQNRMVRLAQGRYQWADAAHGEEATPVPDRAEQPEPRQSLLAESAMTPEQRAEAKRQIVSLLCDEGVRVSHLGKRLGVTSSSVYRMIDELIHEGVIERVEQGVYARPGSQPLRRWGGENGSMSEDRVRQIVAEQIAPLAQRIDVIADQLRRLSEAAPQPHGVSDDAAVIRQMALGLLGVLEAQSGRRTA